MSDVALLFNLSAALVGIWVIFKMALIGMYNYHLFRLSRLSPERRRRRLGGLMRMESVEVSPHHLIEGLKEGVSVPYLPTADRRRVIHLLAIATACAVIGAVSGTPTSGEIVMAVAFPGIAVVTALAMGGIHVVFVEARLRRQDNEKCEKLYQMLSNSDSERFPESI